jgi:hypothetical protein
MTAMKPVGDPDEIRQFIAQVLAVAGLLGGLSPQIRGALPDASGYQGPAADADRALLAQHALLTTGLANELHQVVGTILGGALRQVEDDISQWLAQRAHDLEGVKPAS